MLWKGRWEWVKAERKRRKKEGRKHTGSNLSTGLVVRVTLGKSGADGRGGVADGAAGVLASLGSEVGGGLGNSGLNRGDGSLGGSGRDGGAGDGDDGEERDEGGKKLNHFDGFWWWCLVG